MRHAVGKALDLESVPVDRGRFIELVPHHDAYRLTAPQLEHRAGEHHRIARGNARTLLQREAVGRRSRNEPVEILAYEKLHLARVRR